MKTSCFAKLFKGCKHIVDASNLVLSSTTLKNYCYDGMFEQCSALTAVPAQLPATTLATGCYQGMFNNCTSLTGVPKDLLPASYMMSACYAYMFAYCTSLVNPPDIHAIDTNFECFQQMFLNCTSLTDAPQLFAKKAPYLYSRCFKWTFCGCTSLSSINVGFKDWYYPSYPNEENSPTYGWVDGVAATGVFTKPSGLTEQHGISFIPNNWQVINT